MKTMLKNTVVLGCLALSSLAQAENTVQTTNEINAQTTITRGAIDNVLERMSQQRPNSAFRATDYWAQNKDFQSKLDKALKTFEDTLVKDIFPKAAFWMDQYNSIYNSTEFTSEQKRILIEQRSLNIKNQFVALSSSYQKAIKALYSMVPYYDLKFGFSKAFTKHLCIESDSDSFQAYYTSNGKVIGGSTSIGVTTFDETKYYNYVKLSVNSSVVIEEMDQGSVPGYGYHQGEECKGRSRVSFETASMYNGLGKLKATRTDLYNGAYRAAYPAVKGKCRSSICIGLRTGDLVNLLTQIQTKIDRTITMRLASGETLTLNSAGERTGEIQQMLARVDYPETLPFDI